MKNVSKVKEQRKSRGITLISLIIIVVSIIFVAGGIMVCLQLGKEKNEEKTKLNKTETKEQNNKKEEKIEIGKTTFTNEEVLKKLGIKESKGTYKGTWTVIGFEGDKIKLVSTGNVGYNDALVILGDLDENAYLEDENGNKTKKLRPEIVDLNGDGNLEFEVAVWSYKNAVETLNKAAQDSTGIETARCIMIEDLYDMLGEDNIFISEEDGNIYEYYFKGETVYSKINKLENKNSNLEIGLEYDTQKKSQIFVDNKGETVIVDANNFDKSVELTHNYRGTYRLSSEQIQTLGNLGTSYYWLASRCIKTFDEGATFGIRFASGGAIDSYYLFNSNGDTNGVSRALRAVIYI